MQAFWLYALTIALPKDKGFHPRGFHMLAFATCAIASLSYFCMALGIGNIRVDGREFYFARYIEYVATTPIMLADIGVLLELSPSDLFGICVWDVLMVLAGLFASFTTTKAKFPLFFFGCVCFVIIVARLRNVLKRIYATRTKALTWPFKCFLVSMLICWMGYPVIWYLAEGIFFCASLVHSPTLLSGTRKISVDLEIILNGILDILCK